MPVETIVELFVARRVMYFTRFRRSLDVSIATRLQYSKCLSFSLYI